MNVKTMSVQLLVVCLLSVCVTTVEANVYFQWLSSSGQAQNELSANLAASSTALMFISVDAVVDLNTGTALQSSYGSGTSLDTFIGSVKTSFSGRYTTTSTIFGTDDSYVGMYVYMVLVDTPWVTGVAPEDIAGGKFYGVSSIGQIAGSDTKLTKYDTPTPGLTQSFVDSDAFIKTDVVNVPEPSTVALLGLGLGLIALRRKASRA